MRKLIVAVAALVLLAVVYVPREPARVTSGGPPYRRIVSLVPSVTDLLFAVGAGENVVGVTRYCTHPPEAQSKEKIGDIRVDYEKVAALKPDAVITVRRMTREAAEALERMGLRVEELYGESFGEIADALRKAGRWTGRAERGEEEARKLLARVRAVEERVKGKARPTVFFESSYDPIWSVSGNSYVGDMITRAGGRNILEDMAEPWGPVSWEVVLKADPDVILIGHESTANLDARAGWASLKAVRTGRVHIVTKEEFYFPTPRLADGLERAARLFHGAD